jgi:hypothetical protein
MSLCRVRHDRVRIGGAVPHLELSLIEDPSRFGDARRPDRHVPLSPDDDRAATHLPQARTPAEAPPLAYASSLDRWASVVPGAAEPSLVVAADTTIIAASASCAEMIGLGDPEDARGRRLRDAGVQLVDFTTSLDELDPTEADKIPPLLAISSRRLARGLMRVVCPESKVARTMDAIATPLWDGVTVVGSLTFFSQI